MRCLCGRTVERGEADERTSGIRDKGCGRPTARHGRLGVYESRRRAPCAAAHPFPPACACRRACVHVGCVRAQPDIERSLCVAEHLRQAPLRRALLLCPSLQMLVQYKVS